MIGLNHQGLDSHDAYTEKFGFPFALATDANRSVAEAFHALKDNGTSIERSVYVIGPDGTIRYAARGIPDNSEVFAALSS